MEYFFEVTKRFFSNDNWFGEMIGGISVIALPFLALWIAAGYGY